ncbi:MAG TPA: Ig-like domain-containing protein, partial [Pirellulaceae bacterium]|nr:Ig-like domain-containing protein [Pirellulaceae bacterium]
MMAVLSSPVLDTTIEAVNSEQDAYNNNFSTGGMGGTPPDTHGAVGKTHVLNVSNQTIQWFTKDGTNQMHTSLTNFFAPLHPAPGLGPFDPKAIYDRYTDRYVVIALEVLDTSFGDPINSSRVMIAVSDDSDPNGNWRFQSVNTMQNIGGESQWLDYPGLGIDEEAIYITGNMFGFGNSTALGGSRLWIIDKGNGTGGLYDGGRSAANVYNPAGSMAASTGFTLQPAEMFSPGPVFGNTSNQVGTWMLAYNGASNGTNETVMVVRVDSPLNNPTFNVQNVSVGDIDDTRNTAYPTLPTTPFPALPTVPQRGSTATLDFGDRRMMHAIYRDGFLYATTQVLPPSGEDLNQVTAHWFKFSAANPNQITIADQGNVGGEDISSNVSTSYATVAVDPAGNMAIGFAASGPAMYGGYYYATRSPSDAPGTLRTARAVSEGQSVYDYGGGAAGNRWGDYSATVLDPADNATFWVYGQYARAHDLTLDVPRYGTRWGSFHVSPLPPSGGTTTPTKGYVSGLKWNDLDKDGVKDATETGVAGFTMYVDLNGNDKIDVGEPAAKTDANGQYLIESTSFGTYAVREVPLAGWTQTFPGSAQSFEHTVTIAAGQTVSNINFGNNGQVLDFGDAPSPYPTTLAQNGARHSVLRGFHLGPPTVVPTGSVATGVEPDTEIDGQPEANAQGDDLNGTDDEDGIIFSGNSLVAGGTGTITVIVSTGGNPAGALQGWIDFNGDGDWSDAGEQIVKDKLLIEGTHTVTFAVPSTATSQITYARFRYGYDRGNGPTGSSIAGEVEDYAVQVVSDNPVATNDALQVTQNSVNNVVPVLANDFASSSGGLKIQSVGTPNRGGTATYYNNGTPSNFADDTILYTPVNGFIGTESFTYTVTDNSNKTSSGGLKIQSVGTPNRGGTATYYNNGTPSNFADDTILYTPVNGFIGTESFTYTVTDNSNKTSTATVTMTVVSLTTNPIAIDDSYTFALATPTQLAVLSNDVIGNSGPIRVTGVTQPPSGQGTVSILSGGSLLQYTPPSSTFVGDVQFTYTLADSATPTNRTDTAQVTIHVGNTTADDLVGISLIPYDLNGNQISVINPGQEFELRAYVKDLRTDDTVGNPTDRLGVYAAYFDTLYPSNLVSIAGSIKFNAPPDYSSGKFVAGQSGSTTAPGVIDEVGAFQGTDPAFTQNPYLLYSVRMRANQVGQATFTADPADDLPLHDVLVYEPPSPAVSYQQVTYGAGTLFIGNPADVLFKAVDDIYNVQSTGNTTLLVRNNDLAGLNGPITINSVTPLGNFQGNLVRTNNNTTIEYQAPAGGFTGVQQFTYTIQNSVGALSTATVTLLVGDRATLDTDDVVKIQLVATDLQGNPITSTVVGNQFQVRAFVQDLRADDDPNSTVDRRGVYSAYADVLYSQALASVATTTSGFQITYGT